MKTQSLILWLAVSPLGHASQIPEIAPSERTGPQVEVANDSIALTVAQSRMGRRHQLQYSETLQPGSWHNAGPEALGHGAPLTLSVPRDPENPKRFYRLHLDAELPVEAGHMVFVPGGSFQAGDAITGSGASEGGEGSSISLSPFYLHSTSVTETQWEIVRQWAAAGNGYPDLPEADGKSANHPVHSISWHAAVKWCNARSEMENLTPSYTVDGGQVYRAGDRDDVVCDFSTDGYRLPTQAEWEMAARGGSSGSLFPWGDTISHAAIRSAISAHSSGHPASYANFIGFRPVRSIVTP